MSNDLIKEKLYRELEADHVEILNGSYLHYTDRIVRNFSGIHAAGDSLRIMIVSKQFADLPLIERHRLVNSVLKDELEHYISTLELKPLTPQEWEKEEHVLNG